MKNLSLKRSAGNALKDEDFNKTSIYDKSFKLTRKIQDPRFGEVSLLNNISTKENVIVKEKKFNDKAEMTKAIISTRSKMLNQSPYTFKLLDFSTTKQSELCSTIYILKQFYEYINSDLRREFMSRQSANVSFTEAELSTILYQIVKADPLGTHGDISNSNIVYEKASNTSKLVDRSDELPSMTRSLNIQKNKMTTNQPLYQSPLMYSNLRNNNLKFNFDVNKEDAFALGLNILELGNLRPINNIYNSAKKEIDFSILNRHIEDFKLKYGPNRFLTNTVESLLKFDELQRLGMKEVDLLLPNEIEFKNQILQSNAFYVNSSVYSNQNNIINKSNEPITTISTTVTTTPIPQQHIPSIYSTNNLQNNAFYEKPSLPNIQTNVTKTNYQYVPPQFLNDAPQSNIYITKNEPQRLSERKITTTVIKENVSASPVRYNGDFGNDYRIQTSTVSSPIKQYTSNRNVQLIQNNNTVPIINYPPYTSYTNSGPNRIVLEPEIRREVITAAPMTLTAYNNSLQAYPSMADGNTTIYTQQSNNFNQYQNNPYQTSSYIPKDNIRRSYIRKSITHIPTTNYTNYQPTPLNTFETTRVSTIPTSTYINSPNSFNYNTNLNNIPYNTYSTVQNSYPNTTYTPYNNITEYNSYPTNQINTNNTNRITPIISSVNNLPVTTTYHTAPVTEYINSSTIIPNQYTSDQINYIANNPTTYSTLTPTNFVSTPITTYQTNLPYSSFNNGSNKNVTYMNNNMTQYTTETTTIPVNDFNQTVRKSVSGLKYIGTYQDNSNPTEYRNY